MAGMHHIMSGSDSGGKKRKEREGKDGGSEDDIVFYSEPAPRSPKKKKTRTVPEVGDEVGYSSLQPCPGGSVLGGFEFRKWNGHILHETSEKMFLIERKDASGVVSSHDYVPVKNCHLMWEGRGG